MSSNAMSERINTLFEKEKWEQARKLLEAAREKTPKSHWVLTQLAVTYYEERRYAEALRLLLESRRLVPDCPLTLWNLAGTLDAIGKHRDAVRVYTWLLKSNRTAKNDPCWESTEWTDALKTDCVYRLGACFGRLGKRQIAEHCFRQYLNLLSLGIEGAYSAEDALRHVRGLSANGSGGGRRQANRLRQAFQETLKASGAEAKTGGNGPPALNEAALLAGARAAASK
ncbi:MAG: tetratricopeptide repeat protein [Planctomycetes bacterium]|nr:tetratricopeptide repeat protein [Planctomycetota bacterium]